MENLLLDSDAVARCCRRLAHEVLESLSPGEDAVMLGIPTRGAVLGARLHREITEIDSAAKLEVGTLDVTMYRDDIRKSPVRSPSPTRIPNGGIDGRTVVIVDDVLYTGRTIRAAVDAIADLGRPRAVRLAVLVDRGHREFPIRADFVGKNVPSNRSDRVNVRLVETDGFDGVSFEAAP